MRISVLFLVGFAKTDMSNECRRANLRRSFCDVLQRAKRGCSELNGALFKTQFPDEIQIPNAFVIFNWEDGNTQVKFKCLPDSLDEIENIMYANMTGRKSCKKFLRFIIEAKQRELKEKKSQEKAEQLVNSFLCSNSTRNIPHHYGLAAVNSGHGRQIDMFSYLHRLRTLSGSWVTQLSRSATVYPHFCSCKSVHWQNILATN